jgi:hypothetical protein
MIWLINLICVAFTVMGSIRLATKADVMIGWYLYTVGAFAGIVYFLALRDYFQLIVWIVFIINDAIAIRRKRRARVDKYVRYVKESWKFIDETGRFFEEEFSTRKQAVKEFRKYAKYLCGKK